MASLARCRHALGCQHAGKTQPCSRHAEPVAGFSATWRILWDFNAATTSGSTAGG